MEKIQKAGLALLIAVMAGTAALAPSLIKSHLEEKKLYRARLESFSQIETYHIKHHETLSDIAEKYCPSDINLNDYIRKIEELSKPFLKDKDMVYPGDSIRIPIYSNSNI